MFLTLIHLVSFSFLEKITESGILTWQSQHSQHFGSTVIKQLIQHDHDNNNTKRAGRVDIEVLFKFTK